MMPALVPVTDEHIRYVAARMRACDVAEIWASHHILPEPGLREAVAVSVWAYTGTLDGEPVCIFGVAPRSALAGQGAPWMLATPQLHRGERAFLRLCRPVVEAMQTLFPELVNFVDARNTRTQRWLRWLGFKLEPPAPYGYDGLPFCRFTRSAPCANPLPS